MITLSYLNLITSEFRDKFRYISMLTGIFDQFVAVSNLLDSINSGLDPNIAEGVQLDMIGQYIGQSRRLNLNISGLDSSLSDEDYRFLLKARIAQQAWDGTIDGIYSLWNDLFGEETFVIVDNQDMSCSFTINPASMTQVQIELVISNMIIPKPAGVSYTYNFISKVLFSYDLNTEYFKGYDLGYWNGGSPFEDEEPQGLTSLSEFSFLS